jgi:hypothetical protein
MRRVRVTVLAALKQELLRILCVCNLSYPACNAHAPYCHLWRALLYSIFPHYFKHGTIFGKRKSFSTRNVFDFLWNVCLEHFSFLEELSGIL